MAASGGGAGQEKRGSDGGKEDGRMGPGDVFFFVFYFKGTQTKSLHKVRVRRWRRVIQFSSRTRGGSHAVRFASTSSVLVFPSEAPPPAAAAMSLVFEDPQSKVRSSCPLPSREGRASNGRAAGGEAGLTVGRRDGKRRLPPNHGDGSTKV